MEKDTKKLLVVIFLILYGGSVCICVGGFPQDYDFHGEVIECKRINENYVNSIENYLVKVKTDNNEIITCYSINKLEIGKSYYFYKNGLYDNWLDKEYDSYNATEEKLPFTKREWLSIILLLPLVNVLLHFMIGYFVYLVFKRLIKNKKKKRKKNKRNKKRVEQMIDENKIRNISSDVICNCISGISDEGIKFYRTMYDERHEKYCGVVRWEIQKGFRDRESMKLVRFWCKYYKCEIDVTVCPMLCCDADINRCPVLHELGESE